MHLPVELEGYRVKILIDRWRHSYQNMNPILAAGPVV